MSVAVSALYRKTHVNYDYLAYLRVNPVDVTMLHLYQIHIRRTLPCENRLFKREYVNNLTYYAETQYSRGVIVRDKICHTPKVC